jgi:hypothetical protein
VKVSDIVAKKSQKIKNAENFHSYLLLIFTDELDLEPDEVGLWISNVKIGMDCEFERIFFLMSYHPSIGGYPAFQVSRGGASCEPGSCVSD